MSNQYFPDSQPYYEGASIVHQVNDILTKDPLQREKLQTVVSARIDRNGIKTRASVVLAVLQCNSVYAIAKHMEKSKKFVKRWLSRFVEKGIEGLKDKPRSGRPLSITADEIPEIRESLFCSPSGFKELKDSFKDAQITSDHWTYALLAKVHNVSPATMFRFCVKNGIRLHYSGSYCFSTDLNYNEKLTAVHRTLTREGLDDDAVVLSFDEKPCIQAIERNLVLDRRGNIIPSSRYKRRGTTNLLAALNPHSGKVYTRHTCKKDRAEVGDFLSSIVRDNVELQGKKIIVLLDNLSTHHLDEEWKAQHPQFKFVFTPTTSSWCNPVEPYFEKYSKSVLRNKSFRTVDELIAAGDRWIASYNLEPTSYGWDFDLDHHFKKREETLKMMRQDVATAKRLCQKGKILCNEAFAYVYTAGLILYRLDPESDKSPKAIREYKLKLIQSLPYYGQPKDELKNCA